MKISFQMAVPAGLLPHGRRAESSVFFLSLDTIIRVVMENRIRAQTGMDAQIREVHARPHRNRPSPSRILNYSTRQVSAARRSSTSRKSTPNTTATRSKRANCVRHAPTLQPGRTGHRGKTRLVKRTSFPLHEPCPSRRKNTAPASRIVINSKERRPALKFTGH